MNIQKCTNVSGRSLHQCKKPIYYTRVRVQIINHMRHIANFLLPYINSSLDSYLANGQVTRNKVRVKGIEF